MKENKKQSFFAKLRSGKLLEIFVIAVFAIVVIIALYNAFYKEKENETASGSGYGAQLEARLTDVLSRIDGAGKVSVMIYFADEGETVIAYERVENADGSIVTTPVLVGGKTVVLEELPPEIAGVLIVAEGARDLGVRFRLIDAAASVLNINQSIIKVYEKGSGK